MTLLGKLFRPWDLPTAEDSSDKIPDSHNTIEQKKCKPSKTKSKSLPSSISHSRFPEESRLNCGDKRDRVKSFHSSSSSKQHSPTSSNNMEESETSCSISDLLTFPSNPDLNDFPTLQLLDLNSFQNSTANTNEQNPVFLNPTTVDDLAKLSRNELTAMGLLPPDPPSSQKVKRQRPKRFHCPHCQVAFSNNGQLRGHIRIHTGERPFSCDHEGCGKSFTRNEELTRHRRIHSGLRPYPCTFCGKKFGRKDHLKKHTRTHQRPAVYGTPGGMIGLGNPFHPFNPPLMSSPSGLNDFYSSQSPYGLPFVLSVPPPIPHFPFS